MLLKRQFVRNAILVAPVLFAVTVGFAEAQDVGYRGWGPRVGISGSPSQLFVGAHLDLGELAPRLAFRPNVEVGAGDNETDLAVNFAALYRFRTSWGQWTPYAGGELGLDFRSFDDHHHGESDSKSGVGVSAVGGMEMKLHGRTRFGLELKLGAGEAPGFKFLAHWTF